MIKHDIIRKLINPIAKILIRLGCSFNEVKAILMQEYIEEAILQGCTSHCAIAAKTGIDRRNISLILKNKEGGL